MSSICSISTRGTAAASFILVLCPLFTLQNIRFHKCLIELLLAEDILNINSGQ